MTYKVYLSTKAKPSSLPSVKKNSCIIVIEPEDYTDAQIKAIKAKGYTVIGYLSIGTISTERPFYKKYSQYKKKRLPDWPKEFYMDMTKAPWTNFLINRASSLKKRGFDGWWLDNLDVYEEYKSAATFSACWNLLKNIKKIGGYVMVNGGSEFFDNAMDKNKDLTKVVDGVTQEEVWSLIKDYSGKGKFGTQTKSQGSWYRKYMIRLLKFKVETYLLEYTRSATLKTKIKIWCKKYKMTGYYISGDVNL